MKQREKIVPEAFGEVIEIGIGSGLNLNFYDKSRVKKVTGIDPSQELWDRSKLNSSALPFKFEYINAFAEELPVHNAAFDSVVVTYSLCTIPNLKEAFSEIKRVMKPNGSLLFCEHGKAPDNSIQRWQNLINPIWKKFGGGCNLNRDIPALIEDNGFRIKHLDTMYIPGWKPASFNFWGTAQIS